jgi:capsular polysaccharide biosynthesis protein
MIGSTDQILIDYDGLGFQGESLNALNVPREKLLLPGNHFDFHVRADRLIVPSLTGELGTIPGWVVEFLRDTFLDKSAHAEGGARRRLFVSRRKAPSRREQNYTELLAFLQDRGFEEYIAEDHSIVEAARDFASAEWIVGLHGGGMANLAFASPGTNVIEFFPPRHVDSLFWILSNRVNARHGYLFAEGDYPEMGADIVKDKVDLDVVVSVDKLRRLFDLMSDS